MKLLLLTALTLFVGAGVAGARPCYGVSSYSAGRGTVYEGSRGGSAYVGPRGAAAEGPNGGVAVSNRYGGAAAVGPNGGVAATGRYGGAAVVGPNGNAVVGRPALPAGYYYNVPYGYSTVYYRGYNCYYASGVYYRPVFYQGTTVYVVVN